VEQQMQKPVDIDLRLMHKKKLVGNENLIAQFAFKSDRHEPWPVKSKTLNPN
jgi:hypothetical protein